MVRCRGCRIIGVVATVAGIGCIRVVAVVTSIAIVRDGHVCTYELIHYDPAEGFLCPRRFAVASGAIRGELSSCVVGLRGCCIIGVVTTVAGIRRSIVVAVVTSSTIVGDGGVRSV